MITIVAYSDLHWGKEETLWTLEWTPDYLKCNKLSAIIEELKPDLTISCGDLYEQVYDGGNPPDHKLHQLTDIFILGNHDPWNGRLLWTLEDNLFTHRLEQNCPAGFYNVHGHTHTPGKYINHMDVGSLTLNGTFGLFQEGKWELKEV